MRLWDSHDIKLHGKEKQGRAMRKMSQAQLRNLEKGKPYRWQKGRSGNPFGRRLKDAPSDGVRDVVMVLPAWAGNSAPSRPVASQDPAPTASSACTVPDPPIMRSEDWLTLSRASTPEMRQRDAWKQMVDWDRLQHG
jgi:hypothetical protein